mmetsp:Transcript_11281/g.31210  ORF Transcript_11281/g.31210 Transcript_11281/m.31210 type:complete len:423 (-) Transcript_11281:1207-2475(-)
MTTILRDITPEDLVHDMSAFPPVVFFWITQPIDLVCDVVGCTGWRSLLPSIATKEGAWFSPEFKIQPILHNFPVLLSFQEYLEVNGLQPSLQSMMDYAFRTPSTALGDLTTPTAFGVLLLTMLVMRLVKKTTIPYFSTLGRKAARLTHGPEWEAQNDTRIVKFGEYVFRLIFHSFISIVGVVYFWDKIWWKRGGTVHLFDHFPFHEIEPGMAWYYMVQSAYNMEAMLSLLELSFCVTFQSITSAKGGLQPPVKIQWSPTVRGDFQEMFIHHIVTNTLIISSSGFRFTRIGSMVFLVHDLSDVPVDLSKLANFLKWKITTVVCFVLMVLVWMATRLGALPFIIFRSIAFESWLVLRRGAVDALAVHFYLHIFLVLLGMLIMLHVAWYFMFIRMGWVLVSKGETHDLSEHKTGEVQPESDKKKD